MNKNKKKIKIENDVNISNYILGTGKILQESH